MYYLCVGVVCSVRLKVKMFFMCFGVVLVYRVFGCSVCYMWCLSRVVLCVKVKNRFCVCVICVCCVSCGL